MYSSNYTDFGNTRRQLSHKEFYIQAILNPHRNFNYLSSCRINVNYVPMYGLATTYYAFFIEMEEIRHILLYSLCATLN